MQNTFRKYMLNLWFVHKTSSRVRKLPT